MGADMRWTRIRVSLPLRRKEETVGTRTQSRTILGKLFLLFKAAVGTVETDSVSMERPFRLLTDISDEEWTMRAWVARLPEITDGAS
jgi:hypothetical protein